MTEPSQSNPTPSAIPWTPDMMAPQSTVPQPLSRPQTAPYPSQPHAPQHMPQTQMGQPHYVQNNQPTQPLPHHQMGQPQYAPPQFAQPAPSPQFSQPVTPPPLAPHMRAAQQEGPQVIETERESKSLFAKLLKRSPNPKAAPEVQTPAAGSGSLFNKNFVLGAMTGLVIGAFVLPMALNMIGGTTPPQSQAELIQRPVSEAALIANEGNTFIDNAISSDAP